MWRSWYVFLILALVEQVVAEESIAADAYSESVMIGLLSMDGRLDLSIRLARFPARNNGHVWAHLATPGGAWSVVDESFELSSTAATDVSGAVVELRAQNEKSLINFRSSSRRSEKMLGSVTGSLGISKTRHPDSKPGSIPFNFQLDFESGSTGFRSSTNRWELTGRVSGVVSVGDQTIRINELGKWHEQTGQRARFAPAFSYFNVQNEKMSVLAIGFRDRVLGYAMLGDNLLGLLEFDIADSTTPDREFSITLANQLKIEGVARVVQRWSVPIEGIRRPGTSVLVDSNLGTMVGSLNDWNPPE
jgi:hypothetical protein